MSVIHDFLPPETKKLLLKTERIYLKRIESITHLDELLKDSGHSLAEWVGLLDNMNAPALQATSDYLKAIDQYTHFVQQNKTLFSPLTISTKKKIPSYHFLNKI